MEGKKHIDYRKVLGGIVVLIAVLAIGYYAGSRRTIAPDSPRQVSSQEETTWYEVRFEDLRPRDFDPVDSEPRWRTFVEAHNESRTDFAQPYRGFDPDRVRHRRNPWTGRTESW